MWFSRSLIQFSILFVVLGILFGSGPLIAFGVFLLAATLRGALVGQARPRRRALRARHPREPRLRGRKARRHPAHDQRQAPAGPPGSRYATPSLRTSLLDEDHLSPTGYPGYVHVSRSTHLSWYERIGWPLELEAPPRGYYRLGPARITTGDIFGFFPVEPRARRPTPSSSTHASTRCPSWACRRAPLRRDQGTRPHLRRPEPHRRHPRLPPRRPDAPHRLESVRSPAIAAIAGLRALRDHAPAGRPQRQHHGARLGGLHARPARARPLGRRLGRPARLRRRLRHRPRRQRRLPRERPPDARARRPQLRPAHAHPRGAGRHRPHDPDAPRARDRHAKRSASPTAPRWSASPRAWTRPSPPRCDASPAPATPYRCCRWPKASSRRTSARIRVYNVLTAVRSLEARRLEGATPAPAQPLSPRSELAGWARGPEDEP